MPAPRSSDDLYRSQPVSVTVPVSVLVSPEQALNKAIETLVSSLQTDGHRVIVQEITVRGLRFPVVGKEV